MGAPFRHKSYLYFDASGKRVPAGTPGAVPKVLKSKKWYGRYTNEKGERETVVLYKDLQSSRTELNRLEKEAERRKSGFVDDHVRQAGRPLSEHIKDWGESLESRPITARRRKELLERIRKLIRIAGWERLPQITEDSVRAAILKLSVGPQTRNHYVRHIKQFVAWCIPERLPYSPLTKLKGESVQVDLRHDRRALTDEEQVRLFTATEASQFVYAKWRENEMDGPTRAMLYQVAVSTGLRRGELKSLTRESFDLDTGTVTLAAEFSKHRVRDVLYLPGWIVPLLHKWFEAGKPLWNNLTHHTTKMLRPDLKAAGISYAVKTGDGRKQYADFHSLRHTFCTAVSRLDRIPLKDQMKMTRHTTAELFLNRYAKTNQENLAKAASQLADPRDSVKNRKATG